MIIMVVFDNNEICLLKICLNVQIHEMILSVGNDGSKDGHCRYDGMLGDVFNILLDKLFASGYRYVIFVCSTYYTFQILPFIGAMQQHSPTLDHTMDHHTQVQLVQFNQG